MTETSAHRIVLAVRPTGKPKPSDFRMLDGRNFGKLLIRVAS